MSTRKYIHPNARRDAVSARFGDVTGAGANVGQQRRECTIIEGCRRPPVTHCCDCERWGCAQHMFRFHWVQCVSCNETSWKRQMMDPRNTPGNPEWRWIPVAVVTQIQNGCVRRNSPDDKNFLEESPKNNEVPDGGQNAPSQRSLEDEEEVKWIGRDLYSLISE
jgi:hypothetical protein